MTTATHDGTDVVEIRALIMGWVSAARKGDLDTIMACYTPDVLAFDAIAALQFKGTEAYRKHWEMCLEFMHGNDMIMEVHDLGISVSGDVAFAHYLSRCGYVDEEGREQAGWIRATVCCRKTGAGWRIAHEHYSVPFDPETQQIMDDLAPDAEAAE